MYALKFPNSSLFVNKHSLSIRYDLKVLPYLYNHLSFTATEKRVDIFKTEDIETVIVY